MIRRFCDLCQLEATSGQAALEVVVVRPLFMKDSDGIPTRMHPDVTDTWHFHSSCYEELKVLLQEKAAARILIESRKIDHGEVR